MPSPSKPEDSVYGMTPQEVADVLTIEEGRRVTVQEVLRIECIALRKLRTACICFGLTAANCLPGVVITQTTTTLRKTPR